MTEDLFGKLAQAMNELDDGQVMALTEQALQLGLEPLAVLEQGLANGLRQIGERFDAGECFLPELVIAAGAMEQAVKILEPEILRQGKVYQAKGKVVIGTVQGDIHDIGKNIVTIMLRAYGFEVHDLGVDVTADAFLDKAREVDADIIAASALLTTTMLQQRNLVSTLTELGVRDKFKVLIGGAPTTQQWADEIGADGHAAHATEAVRVAEQLISG